MVPVAVDLGGKSVNNTVTSWIGPGTGGPGGSGVGGLGGKKGK